MTLSLMSLINSYNFKAQMLMPKKHSTGIKFIKIKLHYTTEIKYASLFN